MEELRLRFLPWQTKLFDNRVAKRIVVPKGRRSGLTQGFALHYIESMLLGLSPLLWVDTINTNIDRYVERYFEPILHPLPAKAWQWRQQKKELTIGASKLDFRSAEHPENIEGFAYKKIFLNEAGIILDDPYLWTNAILPMAMDFDPQIYIGGVPKGKINKHTGQEHQFYKLYQEAQADATGRWAHMHVTYRDNKTLSTEAIDELIKEVPDIVRAQEIDGQFIEATLNTIFRPEWWRYYEQMPERSQMVRVIQSWDTAFKEGTQNDFSVCETWGQVGRNYYLLDLFKARMSFPDLTTEAMRLNKQWLPGLILIEDKASGQSLIQVLKKIVDPKRVRDIKVDSDKVTRANACTAAIQQGRVYLPARAGYTKQFVGNHELFPSCEFDDDVDSTTQFLNYVEQKQVSNVNINNYEL